MTENLATNTYFDPVMSVSRADLQYLAEEQLEKLIEDMSVNDLGYGSSVITLEDGSLIEVSNYFGQSMIDIIAPDGKVELGGIIYKIRREGRFYVEIRNPNYDAEKDDSHFLYWVYSNDLMDYLVETMIVEASYGVVTETMRAVAKNKAYANMAEEGVLFGGKITMVPFDFSDISTYFPNDDWQYNRKMYRTNSRCFREAKSFNYEYVNDEHETVSRRFVGYCTGGLVDCMNRELIYDRGIGASTKKRKFQQFNVKDGVVNWFGVSNEWDGETAYHNLNSRTMRFGSESSTGDLELIGEFSHGDFTGALHGYNRPVMTVDPNWGNVMTTLVPPIKINSVKDFSSSKVTVFVAGGLERKQEWGETFPYGDNTTGSGFQSELTYNHDGSSPYADEITPVMNTAGEVGTAFSGHEWAHDETAPTAEISFNANYLQSPEVDRADDSDDFDIYHSVECNFAGICAESERAIIRKKDGESFVCDELPYNNTNVGLCYEGDASSVDMFQAGANCYSSSKKYIKSELRHERTLEAVGGYGSRAGLYYRIVLRTHKVSKNTDNWRCTDVPSPDGVSFDFASRTPSADELPKSSGFCGRASLAKVDYEYTEALNMEYAYCYGRYRYYLEWHAYWVGNVVPLGIPETEVSHTLDMGAECTEDIDLDGGVWCDANTCMFTPDADWSRRYTDLHQSDYGSFAARVWESGPDGLTNQGRLNACNGYVHKIHYDAEEVSKTVILIGDGITWSVEEKLCRRSTEFEYRGYYDPAFAFLDDRACGGGAFIFVGTSNDSEIKNDMSLDHWHILMYKEPSRNIEDVTEDFFDLLGKILDSPNNDDIVDMGLL